MRLTGPPAVEEAEQSMGREADVNQALEETETAFKEARGALNQA